MKTRKFFFGRLVSPAIGLLVFTGSAQADTRIKLDNQDTLDLATSWDVLPVPGDIGLWDSTSGIGNTVGIGAGLSLGAVQVTNGSGGVVINPGTGSLSLGGATINGISSVGLDLSAANRDLTIAAPVTLGATQPWLIGSGRTVFVTNAISGGANGITVQGLGTARLGGTTATGASTYTGPSTINGGRLQIHFTGAVSPALPSPSSLISPATPLVLSSGFFLVQSNANPGGGGAGSPAVLQTVGGATINQGASIIQAARGVAAGLTLGSLTRSGPGGTLLLNSTNGSSNSSTTNFIRTSTTGFIGGWAVWGANVNNQGPTDFAFQNSLNLTAPTYVNNTWAVGNNTTVTADGAIGGASTQSLRFNTAAARTLTLTGSNQISSGGILLTNTVSANNQVITGGVLLGSTNGDLVVHNYSSIAAGGAGSLTINSEIANAIGATALTKTGTGPLILGGNNTFTGGVYLNAGELRLANPGALNATTPNSVSFTRGNLISVLSQVLSLNGNSVTVSGLNTGDVIGTGAATPTVQNGSATAATLTLENASTGTFAGNVQNGTSSAALGLVKSGAGLQNLTGALTYTGATTINGGTLKLAPANNLNASSAVTVGAAGTLDVTAVTSGQSISSGKSLSGSGTILGAVTLANGSTTTPGGIGAVGTLSIDSLTLNSGSTIDFEFGVGNDRINSPALTVDAFSSGGFNLLTTAGAQLVTTGVPYTLFDYTGGSVTGAANLNQGMIVNPVGGLTYTFADTGSAITLTLTGVPSNNAAWTLDSASGNWSTPGNWSTGAVPTNAQDAANFFATSPNNPPHIVVLDSARTVGSVSFNSTSSYSVTGADLLSLSNGAANASISNIQGNHSIATPLRLVSHTNLNVTAAADTLTLSGNIDNVTGTPSLAKFGAGTAILSGVNTYTGPTLVNVGTLRFAKTTALYNNVTSNWTDANIVVNSGATAAFNVGGTGEFTAEDITALNVLGSETGGFKSGSILGLDTTNATGGSYTQRYSIDNSGSGANPLAISKLGTGALILDQGNSHSGGTILQAGVLHLNNDFALGTGPLTINGGTLDNSSGIPITQLFTNPQFWNSSFTFTGSNDLNLGAGAVTLGADTQVTVDAGNLIVGGAISGGFNFAKTGAGKLILTGANAFGGTTTVNGGTLQLGNGGTTGSLPATQISLLNNSVLAYNNFANQTVASQITGNGSVVVVTSGALTQVNFTNPANSFTGGLTIGAGARVALGNTGTGNYFGTGTLTLSGGMLIGSSGGSNTKTFAQNIIVSDLTTSTLETVGSTILTFSGNLSGGGILTRVGGTADVVFASPNNSGFTGTFSAGSLITSGETFSSAGAGSAAATWDFSNSSTNASRTVTLANLAGGTIHFGTLTAAIPSPSFTNTIVNTTSAATISVGATNQDSVYEGVIAGLASGTTGISLTKVGSGTLTLSGPNTYRGITTVSQGVLQVNGNNSGATGAVSVAAGAVLKGGGTVGGSVTAAGIIAPGTAIGTLTVAAAAFAPGGELDIELDDAGSPDADKLVAIGNLDLTNAKLKVIPNGVPASPSYLIARYGTLTGKFATTEALPTGAAIHYAYDDGVDTRNIAIVFPTSPYDLWAVSKSLDLGINADPSQDADNDGVSNILEYVLGGNPLVTSHDLLPLLIPDPTNFIFRFSRTDESKSGAALTFQHGTLLTDWSDIAIGESSAPPAVAIAPNGALPDTITVTIPKGTNPALFGRLKAVRIP